MNLSPDMAEAFADARLYAQHSHTLIKSGPRPEERAENLTTWRRDIGRELAQDLSELLSGARLTVTLSDPETVPGSEVFSRIGTIAANSLLRCGQDDLTLLLSFDFATAIALTDRSFGGEGKPSEDENQEQLPRSAAMLTDTAAKMIAQAIARVSFGANHGNADGTERSLKADVIVRSESATRLKPFDQDTWCSVLMLEICEDGAPGGPISWKAMIAVPAYRLEMLLPSNDTGASTGSASSSASGTDNSTPGKPAKTRDAEPFEGIPLELEAVLAEFEMSLAKLEQMAPGDHIPIAMPREVPLRMGDDVLAHGSLGTLDDRMALKVTRFPKAEAAA